MTFVRPLIAATLTGCMALGATAQQDQQTPQTQQTPPAEQQQQAGEAAAFDTTDAAYSLGFSIGKDILEQDMNLDADAFVDGIRTSLEGGEPRLSEAQMQTAIDRFQQVLITRQMQTFREEARQAGEAGDTQRQMGLEQQAAQLQQMLDRRQQGEANLGRGEQFLDQNRQQPDVQVTDSGLQYQVLEEGEGAQPGASDVVQVHYRGTLLDGTEFDSSHARGEPAQFGVNQVIPGWTEALQLMKVGSRWRLWIPAELAYGARGQGPIPPNSVLIFEVELLDIVNQN